MDEQTNVIWSSCLAQGYEMSRVKLWDEEQHYIVIICFVRFQKSTFKGVKLDYRLGNRGGGEQTIWAKLGNNDASLLPTSFHTPPFSF